MILKLALINGQTGRLIVIAAALLVGACGGGSANPSPDGGGGNGGNAAAGTSGHGGAGGRGGNGGGAGTTGGAGNGGAGTSGSAGAGGSAGSGGATGGTVGAGGAAGTAGRGGSGGTGGAAGAAGTAGRGGSGGAIIGTGGAGGRGGAGGSGTGGATGTGGAAAGGAGGTGPGASCTSDADCQGLAFCDFSNNLCSGSGRCNVKSQDCGVVTPKVCGCNGHIYEGECEANGSVDISDMGNCTPPAGTFACGHLFCTQGSQYCEKMVGGAVTNPGSYACHSLPAGCNGTPSCACVAGSAQCGSCTTSAAGDVTTACLFP